jgi:predicted DNA-binding protein (MmcQ/YjbR family)
MDNERIRAICMGLPYAAETVNWGHHLVYWAGDRALGDKMFAITDLDGSGSGVLSFHCGAERFHELLEIDGIRPTPYSAKYFWVTLERWDALRPRQVEDELKRAHALVFARLPARTKAVLAMPEKERARVMRARKKQAVSGKSKKAPPKSKSRKSS